LFYSSKFAAAVDILRWICLGMALRIISWPMGTIIVAKGNQAVFFATELAWAALSVGLASLCVTSYGANGAGIAFFGSYVFHGFLIYSIVRRLSKFRWSAANRKIGLLFVCSIAIVFCSFYLFTPLIASGIGMLATLASSAYSIRMLVQLVSADSIPRPVLRVLVWLRLRPCES
jgi:enterobacterial common antigen flippase